MGASRAQVAEGHDVYAVAARVTHVSSGKDVECAKSCLGLVVNFRCEGPKAGCGSRTNVRSRASRYERIWFAPMFASSASLAWLVSVAIFRESARSSTVMRTGLGLESTSSGSDLEMASR